MPAVRSSKAAPVTARKTPAFAAHKVDDEATQRALDDVRNTVAPAITCPLLGGRQLTGVKLPSTATVAVAHGLGRVPYGYILTDQTGTTGHGVPVRTAWDESTITFLAPTGDSVVGLWVY